MPNIDAIALPADTGERIWYDGGVITYKMTSVETAGSLSLLEAQMPQGKATPLHVHPDADETLCVLEGEIQTHIDAAMSTVGRNGVVFIPRGKIHAFRVAAGPARILVMFTPASVVSETFFRQAGWPTTTSAPPDASRERLIAAAQRTGLQVVGPPPF